jgi:hypothetical protein
MEDKEHRKARSRPPSRERFDALPADLVAECREISREIDREKEAVRESKVIAAKLRIEDDYYNSDNVLRIVASRLLSESECD